jgi:hypothetical protein
MTDILFVDRMNVNRVYAKITSISKFTVLVINLPTLSLTFSQ